MSTIYYVDRKAPYKGGAFEILEKFLTREDAEQYIIDNALEADKSIRIISSDIPVTGRRAKTGPHAKN